MENEKKPHGNTGRPCSEEKRAKIREALSGRKRGHYSPEHCKAISDAKKGKPMTAAQKKAIDMAIETRRGHTPWNKGKKTGALSEEHRAKIGESGRGLKRSDEIRKKMSETRTGMKFSESHKKALSQHAIQRHANGKWQAYRSKIEMRVGWLVESFGFVMQYRVPGHRHPYDFGNSERKIVIEVNGCYWHSHGCLKKDIGDEIKKTDARHAQAAMDAGYQMIVLWQCQEKQWPIILRDAGIFS